MIRDDENTIQTEIVRLATNYGRYGTPRITRMMRKEGFKINHKRVERIWRELGLKVPRKMPKKLRLHLKDTDVVRFRAEHKNHIWCYDFVEDRLMNGSKLRWLNIVDEYTRECIASIPKRTWSGNAMIETLSDIFMFRETPEYIRSDNGPEFASKKTRDYLQELGIITCFIEPGSPWENGYCESFNGKMRDEFLNLNIFRNRTEAEVLTKRWVWEYNNERPHSSLNYYTPAAYQTLVTNNTNRLTLNVD